MTGCRCVDRDPKAALGSCSSRYCRRGDHIQRSPACEFIQTVIIEFFGMPGAGKSVLAEQLTWVMSEQGEPARLITRAVAPTVGVPLRYMRKGLMAASQGMRQPFAAVRVLLALSRSGQGGRSQVLRRWLELMVTQTIMRRSKPQEMAILDQGLLQAIWSIGIHGSYQGPIETLAATSSAWQLPDLIVVVQVPPAQIASRLDARTSRHSRLQHLDPADQKRQQERGRLLIDAILKDVGVLGLHRDSMVVVENPDGASAVELAQGLAGEAIRRRLRS